MLELPGAVITTSWPDASPLAVETQVTAPIERVMRSLRGTSQIQSFSNEGSSVVRVELTPETNLQRYLAAASGQLAMLRRQLPDQAIPRLEHQVPEAFSEQQRFMVLQLSGPVGRHELRQTAEEVVTPELRSVAGVAAISIDGGENQEVLVRFSEGLVRPAELTTDAVQQTIQEATTAQNFGWVEHRGRRVLLIRSGVEDLEAFKDLVLAVDAKTGATTCLRDLADVSLRPAPRSSISRIDGQPVVSMALDLAPGSHLLRTSKAVRDRVEEIRSQLPRGITLSIADDRADHLRESLGDLVLRGGAGMFCVLLILGAMLGGLRPTAVVVFAVLLSVAVALILLGPFGLTLNLLTLAGLVLIVGLLVDNAVVVVEQLDTARRRHPSWSEGRLLNRVLSNIQVPLVGGTLSTVVVFGPFVYLSGELRTLFGPFALLVFSTLLFSLVAALVVIPAVARFLPVRRHQVRRRRHRRIMTLYALPARFPRITLCFLVLLLGLPTPFLPDFMEEPDDGWSSEQQQLVAERYNTTLGSEGIQELRYTVDPFIGGVTRPFLEQVQLGKSWSFDERPELFVRLALPAGSGIERTDELIGGFERKALDSPVVERTILRVLPDFALMNIRIASTAADSAEAFALREALILEGADFAGLDIAVWGLVPMGFFSGRGRVSGFTVEAYGPAIDGLQELAESMRRRLTRFPRIVDVDLAAGPGQDRNAEARDLLRLLWGNGATARTGLQAKALAAAIQPQIATDRPAFYARLQSGSRTGFRFTSAAAESSDLHALLARPQAGRAFRLGGLAEVSAEKQPVVIERENQVYKRYLRVFFRGPHKMGRDLIESELQYMAPSPGYRLSLQSNRFFTDDVQQELLALLGAALLLIYLILAAVFESWTLPAYVLFSVPMACVGVAVGFLWTGADLAEGAFIGVVLLAGIAVNDSILLVDRYRVLQRRRPASSPSLLARLAIRHRLRPMWTTTLTSVAGMLPMLVAAETQDFWTGLAVMVVGGLLASTLLAPMAMVAWLGLGTRHGKPGRKLLPAPVHTLLTRQT